MDHVLWLEPGLPGDHHHHHTDLALALSQIDVVCSFSYIIFLQTGQCKTLVHCRVPSQFLCCHNHEGFASSSLLALLRVCTAQLFTCFVVTVLLTVFSLSAVHESLWRAEEKAPAKSCGVAGWCGFIWTLVSELESRASWNILQIQQVDRCQYRFIWTFP